MSSACSAEGENIPLPEAARASLLRRCFPNSFAWKKRRKARREEARWSDKTKRVQRGGGHLRVLSTPAAGCLLAEPP